MENEPRVKRTFLAGGVFVVKAYADNYPEIIEDITVSMDFEEAAQFASEATGQGLSTVRARTLAHLRQYLLSRHTVVGKAVRWVHTYEPRIAAWMLLKGAHSLLFTRDFPDIEDGVLRELRIACGRGVNYILADHRFYYGDVDMVLLEKHLRDLARNTLGRYSSQPTAWYSRLVIRGLQSLLNEPVLKREAAWNGLQVPMALDTFVDPLPDYPGYTDTISEAEAALLEARLKELGFFDEENV